VILILSEGTTRRRCNQGGVAFRDQWEDFKGKGAVVLGVSTDSAKSHDKFVEKFKTAVHAAGG